MQAQAVRIAAQGTPEVMKLESVDVAAPGANEAQIRQTAIGVNFMDVYHRGGQYPLPLPDRKSTRLNSSHSQQSRMPSSA